MHVAQLMSKRRVTRSALRSERISARERSNSRALVAAAEAPAVVQEEAVVAVAAVERLVQVVHHDSPSGSLLCPIIKGGDLRTPVQYIERKYV